MVQKALSDLFNSTKTMIRYYQKLSAMIYLVGMIFVSCRDHLAMINTTKECRMFVRKHFRAIASILDDFDNDINKHDLVERMSKYFKSNNKKFQAVRFEDACYRSDV